MNYQIFKFPHSSFSNNSNSFASNVHKTLNTQSLKRDRLSLRKPAEIADVVTETFRQLSAAAFFLLFFKETCQIILLDLLLQIILMRQN